MVENKDKATIFPLTPLVNTGRWSCTYYGRYIIHGPLAARNDHTTVSLKIATWLSMYIIGKQLVHLTPERILQNCSKTTCLEICGNYKTKMVAGSQDGKRWMSLGDQTPSIKRFQEINPDLYPQHVHRRALFQHNEKRLKNCLRSTTTTECMSELGLMHIHKDTELDAERIIHQKNRRILVRHESRRG